MKSRFNHMFVVAYSIESEHPEGEDITPEQHAQAIRARVDQCLLHDEMLEAVGPPTDTYEVEK